MNNWQLSGSYFEVCNCNAPCPCRRLGDKPGGRSTYETCDFALSWLVRDGKAGAVLLNGLSVVLAGTFSDDEPGSPWRVILYVDDRADAEQRQALENIFLGRAGGTPAKSYGPAINEIQAIKQARIELDHTRGRERFKVEPFVEAATAEPFPTAEPISCGIPGHDHPGQELVATHMRVSDGTFDWTVKGRCGFATEFDYRYDD
ncbi:MAG TPA: DUF1326 domain-containing protein [Gammaproteobacteria bacterium]|nr:DUF1326 domain-containing protein [Gammaproteobacteria bacterium]